MALDLMNLPNCWSYSLKALLSFFYVSICILLILSILMQSSKGGQYGAGTSSYASRSFFGSAGSKGFLYTATKWLIALFFILAFVHIAYDYRIMNKAAQKTSLLPIDFIKQ
jgi:protein translocase SecG subunit